MTLLNDFAISQGEEISRRLERLPLNRLHWRLLIIHGMGPLFDSFDFTNVTFIMPALVVAFSLGPVEIGTVGTAAGLGMFFGCIISGPLADRFGRKAIFQLTLLMFSIFTGACALAWDLTSLLVFRIILGIGLGGELPVVASLLSEFLPAKHRGHLMPVYQSFFAFGVILAGASSLALLPQFGWRWVFAVGALPALAAWFIRLWLPESPRWLASSGKLDKAERVMLSLERETENNLKMKLPPVRPQNGLRQTTSPEILHEKVRIKDLFLGVYAKRTTVALSYWFLVLIATGGSSFAIVFLSSKFPLATALSFGLVMALASAPGYWVSAYLLEKVGRKPTLTLYSLIGAVGLFFFPRAVTIPEFTAWGALINFVVVGGVGAIFTYVTEQFPTHLRATATAWANALGRLGMFIAGPLMGYFIATIGWQDAFATSAVALLVGAFVVLALGIETKGRTLEELAGAYRLKWNKSRVPEGFSLLSLNTDSNTHAIFE